MKKKKGFTLIELLAVIIVLAIIALIAMPIIFNVIENAKLKSLENSAYGVVDAVRLQYMENLMNSDSGEVLLNGSVTNLPLSGEHPTGGTWIIQNGKDVTNNRGIKIKDVTFASMQGYVCNSEEIDNKLTGKVICLKGNVQVTLNEPNEPELYSNMIPVIYNDSTSKWKYADISQEWYNYVDKEWANAVVLKTGKTYAVGNDIDIDDIAQMYVWIPRYKYTIFNGNNESVSEQLINVEFEDGIETTGTVRCHDAINQTDSNGNKISEICTDSTNGSIVNGTSTYTHPAFCFGTKNTDGSCNGTELTGIWVGKFETSGSESNLTVLPNQYSFSTITATQQFNNILNVSNSFDIKTDVNTYANSHMMKNMEWGAIAYLKQSKYGLGTTDIALNNYNNESEELYAMTGCGSEVGTTETTTTCSPYDTTNGMQASTTGNIYGVYDMAGGAGEFVMGNMVNSEGNFYTMDDNTFSPENKYYDAYTYDISSSSHTRGKLGDATKETLKIFGDVSGGWYYNYVILPYYDNLFSVYSSWIIRTSGLYDCYGTFTGGCYDNGSVGICGSGGTSRIVITKP